MSDIELILAGICIGLLIAVVLDRYRERILDYLCQFKICRVFFGIIYKRLW